jgi:hypothetical protein
MPEPLRRRNHSATESATRSAGQFCLTGMRAGKLKPRTAGGPRNEPSRNALDSPVDLGGNQSFGSAGGAVGNHMGGGQVSAELAIALAVLTLGSCYASYRLGQRNILERFRRYSDRRREREARWQEFEDFED